MITSINIQVELMMYGYAGVELQALEAGTSASWIAIADGGDMLANETLVIAGKKFDDLIARLNVIELPIKENDEMSRSWSVSFFDEKTNEVKSIERGYWPIEVLETIVQTIDEFMGNGTVTEWIHNIVEA